MAAYSDLHTENFRDVLRDVACRRCGRLGQFELFMKGPNTGIKCSGASCNELHAIDGVQWIRKAENLNKRQKPPETPGETWVRCGDHCYGCGLTRHELKQLGIGCHQHHTKPYADYEHDVVLIPLCADCHEHITAVQRAHKRMRGILIEKEAVA